MEGDKFPIGLKVLVVDDDLACLRILESLLINCKYKVTITTEAVKALEMLREDKDNFDIVISDVHMPRMDGFKLLELIGLELNIPVIMLSGNGNPELVMKGVKHGAVDYLVKPVRQEELMNIWQHVVRKNLHKEKGKADRDNDTGKYGNADLPDARSRKRKEKKITGNNEDEEHEYMDEEGHEVSNTPKKTRLVWSTELHKKFIDAIKHLGPENVFPKQITDFMNVEGVTRESVASHLQKYRLYLKKMNPLSNGSTEATTAALGIQESSTYMNGLPQSNSFGMYCGLSNQINALSLTSLGNQALATTVQPNVGVPCLEDYTRKMEIWRNSSNPQQMVGQGNRLPSSSFNDISYVHNASEHPFVQVSATPGYYFPAQNVGCNVAKSTPYNMDSLMIPNMGSSYQSFGHNNSLQYKDMFDYASGQMNDVGTSSFVQNPEVRDNEVDALMTLDGNYVHESTEMLEDLVQRFIK